MSTGKSRKWFKRVGKEWDRYVGDRATVSEYAAQGAPYLARLRQDLTEWWGDHPDPAQRLKPKRVEEIAQRLADLLRAYTFTDTSEAYARLNTVLDDSFREVGWGFGHTLNSPEIPFPTNRADYVWHSDDFVAVEALVGQEGSSDHLPMVAKLRLTR